MLEHVRAGDIVARYGPTDIEILALETPREVAADTHILPGWLPVPGYGVLAVNAFVIRGAARARHPRRRPGAAARVFCALGRRRRVRATLGDELFGRPGFARAVFRVGIAEEQVGGKRHPGAEPSAENLAPCTLSHSSPNPLLMPASLSPWSALSAPPRPLTIMRIRNFISPAP